MGSYSSLSLVEMPFMFRVKGLGFLWVCAKYVPVFKDVGFSVKNLFCWDLLGEIFVCLCWFKGLGFFIF